jgi:hypothetical protein
MKTLNEILGFVVLTSPLWLFVLLLLLAILIAVATAKLYRSSSKTAVVIGVFILVLVLPFADEITGRVYLNYLCATQAGVKVFRTVSLPPEYWDQTGKPKFFNRYGHLERDFWAKELDESGAQVTRNSSLFAIDKDVTFVRQRSSQKVLAEVTTFRYWGGWIRRNFVPENSANSCKFTNDVNFSRNLYGQLFKPTTSR